MFLRQDLGSAVASRVDAWPSAGRWLR